MMPISKIPTEIPIVRIGKFGEFGEPGRAAARADSPGCRFFLLMTSEKKDEFRQFRILAAIHHPIIQRNPQGHKRGPHAFLRF
ncbi:unnamed protein product [Tuwongella immobilis]|uniref:Uncharacterized protein n=1 Tax=Tuwongella immobilis TaxID=692036 RepID=A0A6C2YKN4_9BACT|nr:unnamed protein product [Tuwongella immobilis]VTR98508.1 unnamed protein product [Tuwongella immobilis]